MGQLGFRGARTSFEHGDADDDGSLWGFLIGGGGGAHFFLAPSFSLDAILLLDYSIGTYHYDAEGGDAGDEKQVINTFELSTLVGVSGWF